MLESRACAPGGPSMKVVCFLLCFAFLMTPFPKPARGQEKSPQTIKVKIEANQWDTGLILKKLNDHGKDHGMKFEVADKDMSTVSLSPPASTRTRFWVSPALVP